MATVDWSNWMNKTPQEQAATWERYRRIVKDESDHARMTNYAAMWNAVYGAQRAMLRTEDEQYRERRRRFA